MDDSSSGRTSLADSASLATASLQSGSSSQNIANDGLIHVYNYRRGDYEKFSPSLHCEEICTIMCRHMDILPTAVLLFGIREQSNGTETSPMTLKVKHKWQLPGELLNSSVRYCFRMRFRVPELDRQLPVIDVHCHKYLYHQMRYDMLHEQIAEIRYPEQRDKVMGLAVMDMVIDREEQLLLAQAVEKAYKSYLPRSLWRAHRIFVRSKIRSTFRRLNSNRPNVDSLKWHYVHQICDLAPTYLTEQFNATVEYFPNESTTEPPHGNGSIASSTRTSTTTLVTGSNTTLSTTITGPGNQRNDSGSDTHTLRGSQQTPQPSRHRASQQQQLQANSIPVYVRLFHHDSPEPGLKVARVTSEATLKVGTAAIDICGHFSETIRHELNLNQKTHFFYVHMCQGQRNYAQLI